MKKRFSFAVAALVILAACADATDPPLSPDSRGPALSGTGLPNLYISYILHQKTEFDEEMDYEITARIRVCNNGTASAGASTTYLLHWWGYNYDVHDLATPALAAGACTTLVSPPLGEWPGTGHSYYVKADDYLVVTESNENDNVKQLDIP